MADPGGATMQLPDDRFLFAYLRDRDVECPGCGYNLRNLTSSICPECGEAVELGLRLTEPKQAALIAGLVGLSAGCGLGGLLLLYVAIVKIFMRQGGGWLDRFIIINGIGFVAHGIVLLLWIRNWRRIRRATAKMRRTLVVICWAMPLTFIVIFARYIR